MRSFRVASILGIEIRIDVSWFVIFFLILWTFSQGVFPAEYPGLPLWTYFAMGLVGALLFFSSLLAHELSHSVVARHRGIPVEGITLFIFGGMARTRMESRSPGEELLIAGVGPLSSVVIALIFGAIYGKSEITKEHVKGAPFLEAGMIGYGVAATAFAGLDQLGLLLKGFEPKVSWDSLGAQSLPSDKSYTPTGVTLMAAMVYDKSKVPSPPSTWQQLLSPQWKGAVGMNDPSQSGPTYPFIAGMMSYLGGVGAGERYFSQLKSNGLIVHPTNGVTLQALTSGQIRIALVQSSAAIGAALGDKKLAVRYLPPVTLLPSAIGIDAKAPAAEQAEARKFIEFVLSPQGQKVMQTGDATGDSLYYPVVQGVSPLPALPPLGSAKTQDINPYSWGPQEGTINTWFDSNIVR